LYAATIRLTEGVPPPRGADGGEPYARRNPANAGAYSACVQASSEEEIQKRGRTGDAPCYEAMQRPTLTDGVITLRAPRAADIDRITAAAQDPETQKWALALPSPYLREHAIAFIERSAAEAQAGTAYSFVAAGEQDQVIAAMRVGADGEIGYWVAPDARGHGVATRAVTLLRDWAHDELGLQRMRMQIHPDNVVSRRVAEKVGFVDTGERLVPNKGVDPDPHAIYVWSAA
jgi:RimJ/RimL family protein N-acetyltransferase